MAEVLFNKNGDPLIAFGKHALIESKSMLDADKATKVNPVVNKTVVAGTHKVLNWGDDNKFPLTANDIIESSTVLSSGLRYKLRLIIGNGIYPVKVTGFDEDGREQYEVISDIELRKLLMSRMFRNYLEKAQADILRYGQAFPEIIFNQEGTKPLIIHTNNANDCRYEVMRNGIIQNVIISAKFNEGTSVGKDYTAVQLLNHINPEADLEEKLAGSARKFIYPLNDPFSGKSYYQQPEWYPAYKAGWLDISVSVPTFLKKMYKNQISWKWHIKIPYAYWDKLFPKTEFRDVVKRRELIEAKIKEIEESVAGELNSSKAIITHFEVGPSGKSEEQWEITPLENKYNSDQQLINSAAANSEILFSLMVNPSVMGAGLPGGPYSGNSGSGSDIREAFLVNIALAWLDRQRLLDPLELFIKKLGYKDVELRFKNTVLTTLDTGKGTSKILS